MLDRLATDGDAPGLATAQVTVFADTANGVHTAIDCPGVVSPFTLPLRVVLDRSPAYVCPSCSGWRSSQEGKLLTEAAGYHRLVDASPPATWRAALDLHRHASLPCPSPQLAALHARASAHAHMLADAARSVLDLYPLYASAAVFAVEFSVRPAEASRLAGWFRAQSIDEPHTIWAEFDEPLAAAIHASPHSWCLARARDGAYGVGAVLWGTASHRVSRHGAQAALCHLPHVVQAGLAACGVEILACDPDAGKAAVGLWDPSCEPLSSLAGALEAARAVL